MATRSKKSRLLSPVTPAAGSASGSATPSTPNAAPGTPSTPSTPGTPSTPAAGTAGGSSSGAMANRLPILEHVKAARALWAPRSTAGHDATTYTHETSVSHVCHSAAHRLLLGALTSDDQRSAVLARWTAHNLINHAEAARTGARHVMRDTEYKEYSPAADSPVTITVTLAAARGLPSSANSYCIARVGSHTGGWTLHRSGKVQRSGMPAWNALFNVQASSTALPTTLVVDVWDDVTGADPLFGSARVNLLPLYSKEQGSNAQWYPLLLGNTSGAEINISIFISPCPTAGSVGHMPWLDAVRDANIPSSAVRSFQIEHVRTMPGGSEVLECSLNYTWEVQRRFQAFRDLHDGLPKLDFRTRYQEAAAGALSKEEEPAPEAPGMTEQLRTLMADMAPRKFEKYSVEMNGLFPLPSTVTGTGPQRRCALLNEAIDMLFFQLHDTGPSGWEYDIRHGALDPVTKFVFTDPGRIRLPISSGAQPSAVRVARPAWSRQTAWTVTDPLPDNVRVPPESVADVGVAWLGKIAPFLGMDDLSNPAPSMESKQDYLDTCLEFGTHANRRLEAYITGHEEVGSKLSMKRHTEYTVQVKLHVVWRVCRSAALADAMMGSPGHTWEDAISVLNAAGMRCLSEPRFLAVINPHFHMPDAERYQFVVDHIRSRLSPMPSVPNRTALLATPEAAPTPAPAAPASPPSTPIADAGTSATPGRGYGTATPVTPGTGMHQDDPASDDDAADSKQEAAEAAAPAAAAAAPRRSAIGNICYALTACCRSEPEPEREPLTAAKPVTPAPKPKPKAAARTWLAPPPPKYLQDTYPTTSQLVAALEKLDQVVTKNSASYGLVSAWLTNAVDALLLQPHKQVFYEAAIRAGMKNYLARNRQFKNLALEVFRLPIDRSAQPTMTYLGYDLRNGFRVGLVWKLPTLQLKASADGEVTLSFHGNAQISAVTVTGQGYLRSIAFHGDWTRLPDVMEFAFAGAPEITYTLNVSARLSLPVPVSSVGAAIIKSRLFALVRDTCVLPCWMPIVTGDNNQLDKQILSALRSFGGPVAP